VGNIDMTKFVRLAALVAAATATATPALAAPTTATPVARARVNIVKPLTLAATRDLHFGTIIVTGDDSVSINAAGTVACGAAANVTCDPTGAQSAQFHVTGSSNQLVRITTTGSNLTLSGGTATLAFTPSAPANVTLPNSGASGADFNVGGSVAVLASAPEGLYVGDINVTVDY
jgi:hypothetical protein